jgi:glutamate-1-semialdehyde 2,1-aminomutase
MKEDTNYTMSVALMQRAKKVLAGGVSSEFRKYAHPHPLFYSHAEDVWIYDADGNKYLDFTLSQGPMIWGHSHPEILKAVESYSRKGQLFAGQHLQELELAEKIQSLIPSAEKMRFCLDGSEAVQTALRIARSKTGKSKFIRFEGHYHGWLDNVVWGNSAPSLAAMGEKEHPQKVAWSGGLSEDSCFESIVAPWNDTTILENIVTENRNEIAAIITEPVMCNNSCILPKEGYLQFLRELCHREGIALIFDEVITGFRMGLAGAQGFFNIQPDLSIFAKAMGNGYPISAIVGKEEWMEEICSSRVIHAGTLNTNNSSVAAALCTIYMLERDHPYGRLFELGQLLMNGLKQLASSKNLPLLVQGPGPMFHTGFSQLTSVNDYRDCFSYNAELNKKFINGLHDEGIRVIGRGLWYISAVHTREHIETAIKAAEKVLSTIIP